MKQARRDWRLGARELPWLAVAAIIVVFGVSIVALRLLDDSTNRAADAPTPASVAGAPTTAAPTTAVMETAPTESNALDPVVAQNAAVALEFMQARAEGDASTAMSLAVDGQMNLGLINGLALMPLELEWKQAVGWEEELGSCDIAVADPANTWVYCTLNLDTAWGRALGHEPYEMEVQLRVNKGEHAPGIWDLTEPTVTDVNVPRIDVAFRTEVWQPLVAWIEANRSDVADQALFGTNDPDLGAFLLPGEREPLITPESIVLWSQLSDEFLAAHGRS